MGHRNDNAISALRAYARDLDATPGSGVLQVAGGSDQDGAQDNTTGSFGAPHQLAIAAVAVGVVLIGSIGIVSARSTSRVNIGPPSSVAQTASAQSATNSPALPQGTANAVKAFNSAGLVRAVAAVESAIASGMDDDPVFIAALVEVQQIVERNVLSGAGVDETVEPLQSALLALESSASRPPGLDIERVPPGQGGTPPGQDPTFVAPGQDPTFVAPGQDPTFVAPGQSGNNGGSSNAKNGSGNSQRPDKSDPGGDS